MTLDRYATQVSTAPPTKPQADPRALQYQKLERENARLIEQLRKAHLVIDVQKKVAALLGRALPETETL